MLLCGQKLADGSVRQSGGHTKATAIATNGVSGILGRVACSTGFFAFKGERSELDPRRYSCRAIPVSCYPPPRSWRRAAAQHGARGRPLPAPAAALVLYMYKAKKGHIWPASTAPLSRLPFVSYKKLYSNYHTASSCAPRPRRPVRPGFRGRLGRLRQKFGWNRLLGGGGSPPLPSGVVLWGSLAPLLYISPLPKRAQLRRALSGWSLLVRRTNPRARAGAPPENPQEDRPDSAPQGELVVHMVVVYGN
jgi:hypothetical protein